MNTDAHERTFSQRTRQENCNNTWLLLLKALLACTGPIGLIVAVIIVKKQWNWDKVHHPDWFDERGVKIANEN